MLKGGLNPLRGPLVACSTSRHAIFPTKVKSSLPMSELGHEHACRLPQRHGTSNSVTRRNRCGAEVFSIVPRTDSCGATSNVYKL